MEKNENNTANEVSAAVTAYSRMGFDNMHQSLTNMFEMLYPDAKERN